jgi:cell division protein FtsL
MTPTAITPAGRRIGKRKSPRHSTREDQPRPVRAPTAPRTPRRVSGPATGRAGTAAPRSKPASPRSKATAGPKPAARTRTTIRTRPAQRHRSTKRLGSISLPWPRRTSGAARPAREGSLRERALAAIQGLPDHPLLDRVVRGRTWIAVLFVMLAGIVAMQVEVLKLNRTMGRAIEQATALQSHNELLRASVASLADDQRIERLAAAQGMVMPAPEDIGFLSASPANVPRAAGHIRTPDSDIFQSLLTSNGGIASTPVPPVMSTGSTTNQPTSGG